MISRRLAVNLVAIGFVAMALFVMYRSFRVVPNARAPVTGTPPDVILFDPEPYRNDLLELETLLYADTADVTTGGRISGIANELGMRVLREEHVMARNRAGADLLAFARDVGDPLGVDLVDLGRLRREWLVVRDAVFRPVSWLRPAEAR